MPLHLLGKKSWNVYNQDNVERVRRDEDAARVAEKEAERRSRDAEGAERLRLLRGEGEPTNDLERLDTPPGSRKRRGGSEDDSDGLLDGGRARDEATKSNSDRSKRRREKDDVGNSEFSTSTSLDQISNMRLRDAAGRHTSAQEPWYSSLNSGGPASVRGRDVWGNEDAGRRKRNEQRLTANDPLLAIKSGVKKLREVEKQKSDWRAEREADLGEVEVLARQERRRRRRKRDGRRERHDAGNERHKHSDGYGRRNRHRSRSRSRSPERSKHQRREK